jgi:uncharacterized protein YbjQ (UPF0145 family)
MNQGPPPAAPPSDLPQHARERIAEMRAKRFFTSDLSVNEFLLVKQAGFDPLGLVMGSSIYQIAPRVPHVPSGQPGCEVAEITHALYHARALAMKRMEEEAAELGADGIIGVRLHVNLDASARAWTLPPLSRDERMMLQRWYWAIAAQRGWGATATTWQQQRQFWQSPMNWPPWLRRKMPQRKGIAFGQNVAEFLAIGTAVRHRDGKSFKNVKGMPFQSDLTGQEFWTLLRAGYRPVGFVMGNCVYYVPPHALRTADAKSTELPACTHALYDARELAIERLQWEAEQLQATGIVGVTVTEKNHAWRRWNNQAPQSPQQIGNAALSLGELLELFVIGTAVVPMDQREPAPSPTLVLVANDAPVSESGGGEE